MENKKSTYSQQCGRAERKIKINIKTRIQIIYINRNYKKIPSIYRGRFIFILEELWINGYKAEMLYSDFLFTQKVYEYLRFELK